MSKGLQEVARTQIAEDASEISRLVRTVLVDGRVSKSMRERLAAILDRSQRISRNSEGL